MKVHSKLSEEERQKRRPPPPWVLMDALHGEVGKPPTKVKSVKAALSRRPNERTQE